MEVWFVPLSLFAGALLAVQAGANAQLAKAVQSPFGATTIQLFIGTLLLLGVAAASGTLDAAAHLPNARWWHAVGGTASALYVVSTILLFPRLGAIVSVGLFIAGQMLASFTLDAFGLLHVAAKPVTLPGAAGLVLVLIGAAAIVLGQGGAPLRRSQSGWVLLALVAGAVLPVQGAVNALLRHDLGAPFVVGAISFFVAFIAMALVLSVLLGLARVPAPSVGGVQRMPWWGWLGGIGGATYVTTVFTAIPAIGTAATVGLTVAGQQIASVFVDRYGWFRLPQRPVSSVRLLGVALLLAGVAVIKAG